MDTNDTNGIPIAAEHRIREIHPHDEVDWRKRFAAEYQDRAIHPHDKVDWRKRFAAVSRYIAELEDCLEEARSIILTQKKQIERFNLNCGKTEGAQNE